MVQMNEVHKMSRDLVVHLLTYQPEGEIENQHHQNWIHDALRVQRALDTCGINHRYVETHQEL